jgi:hypothetical protein
LSHALTLFHVLIASFTKVMHFLSRPSLRT